jgi:hypothetical protein
MPNFFSKKPPRKKPPQQSNTAPAEEHFIPMLLGSVVFCGLLAAAAHPTPAVGDELYFGGTTSLATAGYMAVNADVVPNVWGPDVRSCEMSLPAMIRAKGALDVDAMSGSELFLQWHAANGAAPIGCPGAPLLLAVSVDDYRRMVAWLHASGRTHADG